MEKEKKRKTVGFAEEEIEPEKSSISIAAQKEADHVVSLMKIN
jgi:hypothetical protein